ncbi:MAG: hypothetical protein M3N17_00850 [Actinomycetota bacterium]|nr:hypothetical protein [Actinomycetota bacterium]
MSSTPSGSATDTEDRTAADAGKAKTSAAAVFALVFGLTALFCVLIVILSPLAVLFAILALLLGFVGIGKARERGVTGKGVAVGGLVLGGLALLLSIGLFAGATTFLTDEGNLQRVQKAIDKVAPSSLTP